MIKTIISHLWIIIIAVVWLWSTYKAIKDIVLYISWKRSLKEKIHRRHLNNPHGMFFFFWLIANISIIFIVSLAIWLFSVMLGG